MPYRLRLWFWSLSHDPQKDFWRKVNPALIELGQELQALEKSAGGLFTADDLVKFSAILSAWREKNLRQFVVSLVDFKKMSFYKSEFGDVFQAYRKLHNTLLFAGMSSEIPTTTAGIDGYIRRTITRICDEGWHLEFASICAMPKP